MDEGEQEPVGPVAGGEEDAPLGSVPEGAGVPGPPVTEPFDPDLDTDRDGVLDPGEGLGDTDGDGVRDPRRAVPPLTGAWDAGAEAAGKPRGAGARSVPRPGRPARRDRRWGHEAGRAKRSGREK